MTELEFSPEESTEERLARSHGEVERDDADIMEAEVDEN